MRGGRVNRRQLVSWLSATAFPLAARAQQAGTPPRIGYLSPTARDSEINRAFFGELARLGYTEGHNLAVVFQSYAGSPSALPVLASSLVRAHASLIVADGPELALKAARAATNTLPIVFVAVDYDPIQRGYAESLSHPAGSATGVFVQSVDSIAKQVGTLRAMFPRAVRLTVLFGPEMKDDFAAAEISAKVQGLEVRPVKLGEAPYDFEAIFHAVAQEVASIVLVLPTPSFAAYRTEIAAATLRYRVPAMFGFRTYVEAGGLASYGVNHPAVRRQAAGYVAKVLGGAKPADLPIERADACELVINMTTAKQLGLTIPPPVLAQAQIIK
jgi:putative ABC transport system substrate-binding protein